MGESLLIKYTVARCATHFPLACEAIQVPGQGFDYLCAGDHMIARQLVLRIRQQQVAVGSDRTATTIQRLCGRIRVLFLRQAAGAL